MNLLRTLRSRRGLTLVELLVSMALLGLALTLFAATLSPAARSFQRLETLNDAQIVADDLLETVRSQLEDARGYVKCYDSGQDLAGETGAASGTAIEFVDPSGYVAVLNADGCPETTLRRVSSEDGGTVETSTAAKIDPGYLAVRYYKNDSNQQYTYQTGRDQYVARAMTALYGRGFYVGLYAGLDFSLEPAAGSAKTVTVTVSLYRDAARTDRVFSDQLVVDLRQTPPVKTDVTAVEGT